LLFNGCTSIAITDADKAVLALPEVIEASGSADDAFLGVHLIRTMTMLRGEASATAARFDSVATATSGHWKIEFLVRTDVVAQSLREIALHQPSIERSLSRASVMLDAIFPGNSGRRFSIYLVPPEETFEASWWNLALRDQDVVLRFAFRIPPADAKDWDAWSNKLIEFLAHEYSHSYFWFRPKPFKDAFDDEVAAYSVQRCVHIKITGSPYDTLDRTYQPFFQSVSGMSVSSVYARYHSSLPDTYLGNVAAEIMFQKFIRDTHAVNPASAAAYCAAIVRDGSEAVWVASH